ncbi:ribonuclease III, partial [Mammaliicoccus sciuri]|uniref:ribonuclease III family protein n=1 Tax=Mammaliicoccus sciuri TaxID=1296 RepID=UPI000FED9838
ADVFEAVVGALYLDQGIEVVERFANAIIFPYVEDNALSGVVDFKTQLQEMAHQTLRSTVSYRLIKEDGPAHHRQFTSEVLLDNVAVASGMGRTKKESEQKAAEKALLQLSNKE